MNLSQILLFLYASVFLSGLLACNTEEGPNASKIELQWEYCFNSRFVFRNDSITQKEYVRFKLDGQQKSIDNIRSGMEGDKFYSSSFFTYSPDIQFGGSSTRNRLHLGFITKEHFKHVGLVLAYPQDSLNWAMQKCFSESIIACASNFQETGLSYVMETGCTPNGDVSFATLYSDIPHQYIKVDSFNYSYSNGFWKYYLEYSFDNIEVTNNRWNSKSKIDSKGKKKKSEVYIEDLIITDFKCVLEFELPED